MCLLPLAQIARARPTLGSSALLRSAPLRFALLCFPRDRRQPAPVQAGAKQHGPTSHASRAGGGAETLTRTCTGAFGDLSRAAFSQVRDERREGAACTRPVSASGGTVELAPHRTMGYDVAVAVATQMPPGGNASMCAMIQ